MSDQMGKTNVKKSKQLVSAGVFIALYFVVFAVIGTVCMPVPPLYLAMTSIIALVGAPVYLMLVAKATLHGPIFIAAVLPSLFLLLMGNIWIVVPFGALFGILAEVIAGSGGFKSKGRNAISYLFFDLNLIGGFLPIWVMRDYFFADTLSRGMSQEFVDALASITPIWVLLVMIVATVACGFVGVLISERMFKKHFQKAGIVS